MKTIAVIVRSPDPRRMTEALRAALGLTLRGDRVRVVLASTVSSTHTGRALPTLTLLGHEITRGDAAIADALAGADAVEVWS